MQEGWDNYNGKLPPHFLNLVKFHLRLLLSRVLPCLQTHQCLNCVLLSSDNPFCVKVTLQRGGKKPSFFANYYVCLLWAKPVRALIPADSEELSCHFLVQLAYVWIVELVSPLSAWKLWEEDGVVDLSNAVKWSLLVCLQSSCQSGIGITTLCPTSYV